MQAITIHQPDAETIDLLRALRRQAEAGELQSLIYSAEKVGGHVQSGYTVIADCYAVIGQLERMKYLLQQALDDNSVAEESSGVAGGGLIDRPQVGRQ